MLDLNSMSRTDLMKRIDVACKAITENQESESRRTIKELDLSSFQNKLQNIYTYNAEVDGNYLIAMFIISFFISGVVFAYLFNLIDSSPSPFPIEYLCAAFMPSLVLGCVITFMAEKSKQKSLNKKFQKKVKAYNTVERIQNEIKEAQRQLAIAENEMKEVYRKNASVIQVFPPDYQSLPKLQGIYQILYNQRAMNWAGAASLYLQESMQQEKLQEEKRHNQQMEQARQELVRKQEEQKRMLELQTQQFIAQNQHIADQQRQAADEIAGRLANIEANINMK